MISVMAYFAIIWFSAKTPEPLNLLLTGITSRLMSSERWAKTSTTPTQSEGSAKPDARRKAKERIAGRTFEIGQQEGENTAHTSRGGATIVQDDEKFSTENPMRKSAATEEDNRFDSSNPMLNGQRFDDESRHGTKAAQSSKSASSSF